MPRQAAPNAIQKFSVQNHSQGGVHVGAPLAGVLGGDIDLILLLPKSKKQTKKLDNQV